MTEATTLDHIKQAAPFHNWNPNYDLIEEERWRSRKIIMNCTRPAIKSIYGNDPVRFIMDFGITYDPRRKEVKKIPFDLFEKQKELIESKS